MCCWGLHSACCALKYRHFLSAFHLRFFFFFYLRLQILLATGLFFVLFSAIANSHLQNSIYESLTRKNGVIVSPPDGVRVEDVVMGLGKLVGFENVFAASKMNQRVVVFLSEERYVAQAVETGLSLPPDIFVNVSMLDSPAVKITLSNLPPFVKNGRSCPFWDNSARWCQKSP